MLTYFIASSLHRLIYLKSMRAVLYTWNESFMYMDLQCKFWVLFTYKCFFNLVSKHLLMIFSSPSYYVWVTLVIVQIFDFRFMGDLLVLGSGESKKHKISMVSGCSLVCLLVCLFVSLWRWYLLNKSS